MLTHDTPAVVAPALESYVRSFVRWLRAANKADLTIKTYTAELVLLGAYLSARGMPTDPTRMTREHVEEFITDRLATVAPGTAAKSFACLRIFFNWLLDEGEIT